MTIANEWLWVVFDNLHALGEQATTHWQSECADTSTISAVSLHTTNQQTSGGIFNIESADLHVLLYGVCGAGRIDEQFEFKDPRNLLVGELGDDSQFEVSSNDSQWDVPRVRSVKIFLCVCRQEHDDSVQAGDVRARPPLRTDLTAAGRVGSYKVASSCSPSATLCAVSRCAGSNIL